MPIEHVNNGGKIVITRDQRYPTKDSSRLNPRGSFTLESIKDWALEAEVAGVPPTEHVWFTHDNDVVSSLYFPTDGSPEYMGPRVPVEPQSHEPPFWLAFLTPFFLVALFFVGVLIGAVMF